jgi:hypothetical protein
MNNKLLLSKMNKHFNYIFYLLVILAFCICKKPTENNNGNIALKGDRLLGIELGAAENEEFDSAVSKAKEAKIDFNHVSLRWFDIEPARDSFVDPYNYLEIIDFYYPLKNIKILLTLLSPINTTVSSMPAFLNGKSLNDPEVIEHYKKLLDYILPRLPNTNLIGLVLGNEINIYLSIHTDEKEAFKEFFIAVSGYARTKRPGLKVSFSSTLYGTVGALKDYIYDLNQYTDFVCLTYYPLNADFTVKDPEVVGQDFKNVYDLYSKPIYFQECGYPTSPDCNSNEELQSRFVEEVFKSWDQYKSKIQLICFYKLTDSPLEDVYAYLNEIGLTSNPALTGYVATLGFRTYHQPVVAKKSFNTIKLMTSQRKW